MQIQANSLPAMLESIIRDRQITPELIATEIGVSPMTVLSLEKWSSFS